MSDRAVLESPGVGLSAGRALAAARDGLAGRLVRAGVGPDAISWAGLACGAAAGACLAAGAGHASPLDPFRPGAVPVTWWPFLAACAITASGLLDVVDGAVARLGGSATPFGGVLDSTLDRWADLAMHLGVALHFAVAGRPGMVALAVLSLAHGAQIAYLRARAELVVAHAPVGFWQRSERVFVLGFAASIGHVPAALWVLGTLPALTAWRRLRLVRALLEGRDERPAPPWALWRRRRGSLGWDAVAALVIALLVAGPWLVPALR